jgi:toxin secretion/phage lysis holin
VDKIQDFLATGKGTSIFKSLVLFFSFVASTILGGWDMALKVLVFVVITDFITGVLAGAYEGKLSISIGHRGIIKKVTIFIIVALAYQLDCALGMAYIRTTVIYFYIVMEAISILENAERTGITTPDFLRKLLKQVRDTTNNGENNDVR